MICSSRRISHSELGNEIPAEGYKSQMWQTITDCFQVNPTSKSAKMCGDKDALSGRKPLQMGWYRLASNLAEGKTVLDVGCSAGEGLKLLADRAREAIGIDLDERMKREDLQIQIKSLSEVPDKSTDVSVSVDVIEHDVHGLLVAPADEASLSAGIWQLLADRDRAARRRVAEQFTEEGQIALLTEIVQDGFNPPRT